MIRRPSSAPDHFRFPRRSVLIGLVGTAGSAILAACGEEGTATVAPTTPPTAAPTAAPPTVAATRAATMAPPAATAPAAATTGGAPTAMPPLMVGRRVTVDYWHALGGGPSGRLTSDFVKRFNDANPSITLTEKVYPGYPELVTGLQAAIAARVAPAISQIGLGYLRYTANYLPHTNVDELARRDPQGGEFLRSFSATTLELGKVDGVLHGMLYSVSVPVIYTNLDLFRQAGIERPPQAWDEMRATVRTIKERTGKPGAYIDLANNFWTYQALIEGNGAQLLVGSGKDVRCGIDSPEAIEAVQLMADMILKDKSALQATQMQGQASFRAGEVAMNSASIAQLANNQQSAKFALGTAKFPLWGTKPRRAPVGGNALFIHATDPAQQAAGWEWIKYLLSPDALTAWVPGTGYLSPRLGLAENPKYLKTHYDMNPLVRPALEEIPDMVPWISYPGRNGLQAPQELFEAVQMVLAGADAASTLRAAARRVNEMIKD